MRKLNAARIVFCVMAIVAYCVLSCVAPRRSSLDAVLDEPVVATPPEPDSAELVALRSKMLGKHVWIKMGPDILAANGKPVWYQNNEKMTVVAVTETIGYRPRLMKLTVRNKKNEEGQIEYDPNYVLTEKPVPVAEPKPVAVDKVQIGMTRDQVVAVTGRPNRINETRTVNGTREQWVYGLGDYVYFTNGFVSGVQLSH